MAPEPLADDAASSPLPTLRAVLRRDGRACLVGAALTAAVTLGCYLGARAAGVGETFSLLAALAVGTLWLAMASPVLAASGADWLASLVRAGCLADASGAALLALAGVSDRLALLPAVKVYCIHVGIMLLAVTVVRCFRSRAGRTAGAVAAAALIFLMLATPFWIGGLARGAGPSTRRLVVSGAVRVNPFYSITAAVVGQTGFSWNEAAVMYAKVQQIQDHAPPSPNWYSAPLTCLVLSAVFLAVGLLRFPLAPQRKGPAEPSSGPPAA